MKDVGLPTASADPERGRLTQFNVKNLALLRLPAEIRNKIYKLVFRETCISVLPSRQGLPTFDRPFIFTGATALLFVCRQVHAETRSLFLSTGVFDFTSCISYLNPYSTVGDYGHLPLPDREQCQHFRSIKMTNCGLDDIIYDDMCGGKETASLRNAGYFVGLRRVYLDGTRDELEPDAEDKLAEFKGAFGKDELEVVFRTQPDFIW